MVIAQIFSRLSVRARIIVLGVIPVIGFLANGTAFLSGDTEVGRAFDSVQRNSEVAAASRDLKTGLLMMRAATSAFVAHPSDAEVKNFDDGQALAMQCLDRIEATLALDAQDTITPLRITVRDLRASFGSLVEEQRSLGFDETAGVTADLIAASKTVEDIIHDDLSWVADADRDKLLVSLLTMRRYGMEYRLRHDEAIERHFLDEVKHFGDLFDSVDGAPAMKEKLSRAVQSYRSIFSQFVASTENIAPLVSLISHDTASVLPEADKIIDAARQNSTDRRQRDLAVSRSRTRHFIIWVGLSVVLLGLACSWRIGRSITHPARGVGRAP